MRKKSKKLNPKKLAKGALLQQQGNLPEAEKFYIKLVQASSANLDANINLAKIYLQTQQFQKAITYLNTALSIKPNDIELRHYLAIAFIHVGKANEAKVILEAICADNPKIPEVLNNLGNLYTAEGNDHKALELFARAIALRSNYPDPYNNQAAIFKKLGKYQQAKAALKKCLQYEPNHILALTNLGKLYKREEDYKSAYKYLQKAVTINPTEISALSGLAEIYRLQDKLAEAIAILANLFKLAENHADGHLTMGLICKKQKNHPQAIKHFEISERVNDKSSVLTLSHLIFCCLEIMDWVAVEKFTRKLEQILVANDYIDEIPPFQACIAIQDMRQQQVITEKWCARISATKTTEPFSSYAAVGSKIRIGYISPDFYSHPVGFLLNNLFTNHNREEFEIFGFATAHHNDQYFTLIADSVDHMIRLDQMIPFEAAQVIYKHNIDVLVDLTGHTDKDNLSILAYQPAKIQCHWLGYTGTLGADFIQYQIADQYLIPDDFSAYYTENILRLPALYATALLPPVPTSTERRSDYGLPEDAFVFCYHNDLYRINQVLFSAWIKILTSVPNSVLWLSTGLDIQKYNIYQHAVNAGIAKERIIFSKPFTLSEKYTHCLSDLWLDTFRYTAGTASLLCLWGQLPILSMAGNTPQSRVSTTYLQSLGVPELIATSADDYVGKAIALASDPDLYEEIKQKIAAGCKDSKLFKPKQFIKHLEDGYKTILANYHDDIEPSAEKIVTIN